jgi:beta-barrel assembly-enhancing protease
MMMKNIFVAIFAIVLLAASAQAQFGGWAGKVMNKGSKVAEASRPWTPEEEQAIGDRAAAKLIHVFGVYNNPDMNKYVQMVGSTVAQFGNRTEVTYHFAILDTDIANAFAMPGGYVFVTRGALRNMKNESELAGVLAHEVAHVDNRHLEREIREKKFTGIAVETGVESGTEHVPYGSWVNVDNMLTKALTNVFSQGYAPAKESEADKEGTDLATKAGYQATGLRDFLQTLSDLSANSDMQRSTNMFNGHSHPPFPDRIAKLTRQTAGVSGGETLEARFKQNMNLVPSDKAAKTTRAAK